MDVNLNNRITHEQVKLLLSDKGKSTLIGNTIGALVLSFVLWEIINHTWLITWLCATVIVSSARFYFAQKYWKNHQPCVESHKWLNIIHWGVTAQSLVFVCAALFLYPASSPIHQLFMGAFFVGVATAAANNLSPNQIAAFIFAIPAYFVVCIQMITSADTVIITAGIAFSYLLLVLISATKRNHDTINQNIKLRIESEEREAIIVASEERTKLFARAVEQSEESIMITDALGTVQHVNQTFQNVTGISENEIIGKPSSSFHIFKAHDELMLEILKAVHSGHDFQKSIIATGKGEKDYAAILSITPILNQYKVTHFIYSLKDVSQMQDLEDRLRQSQKMESIGMLAGGIAHNMNNALGGMLGNIYLLHKKFKDDDYASQKLTKIENLANKTTLIVKQLLTFARRDMIQFKELELHQFLEATFDLHRATIPQNIDFSIDNNNPNTRFFVNADENQLQQVIINLLNNARDAVEDVLHPSIKVSLSKSSRVAPSSPNQLPQPFICISIQDNGTGINEDALNKIFEPFFTTKEVGKGTGLGLAMCHGAIASHGGTIEATSKPQETTFNIYLPLIKHTYVPDVIEARDTQHHVTFGNGESILLVDDSIELLDTAKDVLASLNYNVFTARDGLEAIDVFKAHQKEISLCLLDVIMPKLNGTEASKRILKINPKVHILFCTGHDDSMLKNVADEYILRKPFNIIDLSQVVHSKLQENSD